MLKQQSKITESKKEIDALKRELAMQKDINEGLIEKISASETKIRELIKQNKEFDEHNQLLMTANDNLTAKLDDYERNLVKDDLPLDAFFDELERIARIQIQLAAFFIRTYNQKSHDTAIEQLAPIERFFTGK